MGQSDGEVDRHGVGLHQFGHAHTAPLEAAARHRGVVGTHHDHGGRFPGQEGADELLFRVEVIVGQADHGSPAGRIQGGVDAAQDLGKHDVGQGRHADADEARHGRGQRAREPVGHVAHLLDGRHDPGARPLRDGPDAAQDARHGDLADVGPRGDVGQRDRPSFERAECLSTHASGAVLAGRRSRGGAGPLLYV